MENFLFQGFRPVLFEIIDSCNVPQALRKEITKQLEKIAMERIGEQIVYDLVQKTREILTNDQDERKAKETKLRNEEEQTWRDIDEEVKKRVDQSKQGKPTCSPSLTRPASLMVKPQAPSTQAAVQKITPKFRIRSESMSFDNSSNGENQKHSDDELLTFMVSAQSETYALDVRCSNPIKPTFLGNNVSLQFGHSMKSFEGSTTFLVVNGKFSVDPLNPHTQILRSIDIIERDFDALKQSLPSEGSKHLVQMFAFRAIPGTVSPSFQLLLKFPGYGTFLNDLVGKGHLLPINSVRSITRQIAEGLRYLHQHNILYRFLIPELVCISLPNEEVSLMLYGIGKDIIDHIPAGQRNKTVESRWRFIRRFKESKKTDVLQFGFLVYYMVCAGQYPDTFPVTLATGPYSQHEYLMSLVEALTAEKENYRPTMNAVLQMPYLASETEDRELLEIREHSDEEFDESDRDEDSDLEHSSLNSDASPIEAEEYKTYSRLHNDFRILDVLGRGGFGECFRAQNKLDGRLYAIKRVQLPSHEHLLNQMILREVKLLSRLNHDNIVRYFNAWQERVRIPKHRRKNDTLSPQMTPNDTESNGKAFNLFIYSFYSLSITS